MGQKARGPVRGLRSPPTRTPVPPVYRANLNHPVDLAEHGKAASLDPARNRADLTARRVRRPSIGMTEEAKASGNALDMPTSVWSEMARKQVEPLVNPEKQMTASACWLMRPGATAHRSGGHCGCLQVSPSCSVRFGGTGRRAGHKRNKRPAL